MTKIEYVIQEHQDDDGDWEDIFSYSEEEYIKATERFDFYKNKYPKSKLRLIKRKIVDPEELILDESF